jgi:hypothetical protein
MKKEIITFGSFKFGLPFREKLGNMVAESGAPDQLSVGVVVEVVVAVVDVMATAAVLSFLLRLSDFLLILTKAKDLRASANTFVDPAVCCFLFDAAADFRHMFFFGATIGAFKFSTDERCRLPSSALRSVVNSSSTLLSSDSDDCDDSDGSDGSEDSDECRRRCCDLLAGFAEASDEFRFFPLESSIEEKLFSSLLREREEEGKPNSDVLMYRGLLRGCSFPCRPRAGRLS